MSEFQYFSGLRVGVTVANTGDEMAQAKVHFYGKEGSFWRRGATGKQIIDEVREKFCQDCTVARCNLHPSNLKRDEIETYNKKPSFGKGIMLIAQIAYRISDLRALEQIIMTAKCMEGSRFALLPKVRTFAKKHQKSQIPPPKSS